MVVIAIIIQLFIGIPHLNDVDPVGARFGTLTVLEATLGLLGLFFIDPIRSLGFRLRPKKDEWQPIDMYSGYTLMVAFPLNILLQLIVVIPLTIRDYEMALAIVFAAPCEEVFFRGVLMSLFMRGDQIWDKLPKVKVLNQKRDEYGKILHQEKYISILTASGIFISSLIFALFHVNYYDDWRLMAMVFLGGVVYATVFLIWERLTGCILAHLGINIIATIQMFWLVRLV